MPSGIKALLYELIPHSPNLGLYLAPDIPERKLANALGDFARSVDRKDVLALYDATLSGNAKDGAVFTSTGLVFQNNDLSPSQEIRYEDIVGVKVKRKLLGGKKIRVDVNRGRATVTFVVDFSGKSDAADFVNRFLYEAMMHTIEIDERDRTGASMGNGTDLAAVKETLDMLVANGHLSGQDRDAMLRALDE